jgi:predicted ribosome quality control (RQC) complex YloA/Tae2 family protein
MQPVDLTTLVAVCAEIEQNCLPARLEQVYQPNSLTLYLQFRTATTKHWLLISWHPQAARIHLIEQPQRQPDTFTFSQQIWHQVANLALVSIKISRPWDRVVQLEFAKRPGDQVLWRLYVEVMGKRSNVILVNGEDLIITAAHQVSDRQSRLRSIQTGDRYQLPPLRLDPCPSLSEPFDQWRERLSLIPQSIRTNLLKTYQGTSSSLIHLLLANANISPDRLSEELVDSDWQKLFKAWISWIECLEDARFSPYYQDSESYSVFNLVSDSESLNLNSSNPNRSNLGTSNIEPDKLGRISVLAEKVIEPSLSVNHLLKSYYGDRLNRQVFNQLHQQIGQAIDSQISKLQLKANSFRQRLSQSEQSEQTKAIADLLMANLHLSQTGMNEIILPDFNTDQLIKITLDPTQTASQNAQALYKKYQKLKRTKGAISPLLTETESEIDYLVQVKIQAAELEAKDYRSLEEIQRELIQQGYLRGVDRSNTSSRSKKTEAPNCHHYISPSGYEIWVGRNNYQNDLITFRVANEYDLWFHAQEISSAHVLLRLEPGTSAELVDLQAAADACAYHSRARQSDHVPVVYTQPRFVFKPKGSKPGTVVYKHEKVLWGSPRILDRKLS